MSGHLLLVKGVSCRTSRNCFFALSVYLYVALLIFLFAFTALRISALLLTFIFAFTFLCVSVLLCFKCLESEDEW